MAGRIHTNHTAAVLAEINSQNREAIHKTLRASEQGRSDIAEKRKRWRCWQSWLKPDRLVFLDETGLKTNMTRLRGRSFKGERLHASAPWGHWNTSTLLAGLRTAGLVAPLILDGPMNGAAFKAYVEQFLAPTLRPGDVVILDNLASHKVDGVRQAIKLRGAFILYLPPYSPDLNPIEMAFSKLKTLIRKAAERTAETLCRRVGQILNEFSPQECFNYIAHAGYHAYQS